MIIILEGADGCGKTSTSQCLHNLLPLSNMIKLSGAPKDVNSKEWMERIYWNSELFLSTLSNKSVVIMDRAWPSEWVYAPLFKGYSVDYIRNFQNELHRSTNVVYIYLETSPEVLHERIINEKAVIQPKEEHPDWDTIEKVSSAYDRWYEEFHQDFTARYYKINTDEKYPQEIAKKIMRLLELDSDIKDDTYSRIIKKEGSDDVSGTIIGLLGADTVKGHDPSKAVKNRGFEHVAEQFMIYGEEGFIPKRATKNSAGYDIKTPIDFIIKPGEKKMIATNIKAYMNPNEVLELHVRSSVGIKQGIVLSNITGIVDADFYANPENDGNIHIALWNTSNNYVSFRRGDAICQGIFREYKVVDNDKPVSEERVGGIGSTS